MSTPPFGSAHVPLAAAPGTAIFAEKCTPATPVATMARTFSGVIPAPACTSSCPPTARTISASIALPSNTLGAPPEVRIRVTPVPTSARAHRSMDVSEHHPGLISVELKPARARSHEHVNLRRIIHRLLDQAHRRCQPAKRQRATELNPLDSERISNLNSRNVLRR